MLSEDVLNALPESIYQRLNAINTECLNRIGQKVKEIGMLSPGDLRKLQRIQAYGTEDIERELERITAKNTREIYEIIDAVAKDIYTSAAPLYDAKGIEQIPYAENRNLLRYVESIARQTVGEYINLTQHTAFCIFGADGTTNSFFKANSNKIPTTLSETYTKVIDEAVTAAQTGLTDYYSAMRRTMKALADSGVRTVDYATGYSRRLDTSVRQNVLWGVKQCAQGVSDQVGEELGTDGWEISYHSNPRPSHENMGGRQYTAGDTGVTISGKYYPPFKGGAESPEALLKDYNCLHYKFPILLGISEPVYDDDELAALKANDKRTIEYEGKTYTGYEATQVQRKLETEIRRQKDRANTAAACGDDEMRREAQEKINQLTRHYANFSKAAGLPTHMERMRVAGFHRVKTIDELVKERGTSGKAKFSTVENSINLNMLKSKEYKQKFKGITANVKVNNAIYEYSKAILTHRNGTYFEDLCLVDAQSGRLAALEANSTVENVVDYSKNTELLIKRNPYRYIAIHNHGTNNPPTGSDFVSAGARKYKLGIVVCHNGDIYTYQSGSKPFSRKYFDDTVDGFREKAYNDHDAIIETLKQFEKEYGISWEKR